MTNQILRVRWLVSYGANDASLAFQAWYISAPRTCDAALLIGKHVGAVWSRPHHFPLSRGSRITGRCFMELVVPFMNSSVSSASAARVPVRGHACVLCQQRKVKCSRETPCSGCIKSRAECVYRDPAPPRRRKRRSPEDVLLARLKRYEELLQSAGIKVDPVHSANEAAAEDDQLDEREPGHTSALDTASRIEVGEYDMSGSNPFGGSLSTDSGNDGSTNPGQFTSEAGRSRYLEK